MDNPEDREDAKKPDKPAQKPVGRWTKILMGGLGALMPIVVSALVVTPQSFAHGFDGAMVAGWTVKVIALFFLGGVVAFLHQDEVSLTKLFELGIAAPALITTVLNGANLESTPPIVGEGVAESVVERSAAADEAPAPAENQPLKQFAPPHESAGKRFARGVTGAPAQRVFFVIAGNHYEEAAARQQAASINQETPEFHAEVYAPHGHDRRFKVVIGENLTRQDAQAIKIKAVEAGFTNAYLWKLTE